jgi:hypothetical protein
MQQQQQQQQHSDRHHHHSPLPAALSHQPCVCACVVPARGCISGIQQQQQQ